MDTTLSRSVLSPLTGLTPGGTQLLPVSGTITDRLLVTYRADARRLARLVPAPLVLDTFEGRGFVSVCAVEIVDMRIASSPRALWFDNRELLYRISVRLRGQPTFLTLRSDVSSRALALLGRYFSHYRPRHAEVTLTRESERLALRCKSGDGAGDGQVSADLSQAPRVHSSLFADAEAASAFLLGMSFSVDVVDARVRVQPITHSPWQPRAVELREARFTFLDRLADTLGTSFVYDGTLAVHDVSQVWAAASWR